MLHSLHIATFHNDCHSVNKALFDGVDVNLTDEYETTPLHIAAEMGHIELIKTLVHHGADPCLLNSNDMSPLHLAVAFGKLDAISTLFLLGTNINVRNRKNETPLYTALKFRNNSVAKHLIHLGAKQKSINLAEQSALHIAILNEDLEMVQWLIDNGADQKAANFLKMLPLHLAILFNKTQIAKYLINTKINLRTTFRLQGKLLFPFELAALNGEVELMSSLVEKNAGQFHEDRSTKFIKRDLILSPDFYVMLASWGMKQGYIKLVFSLVFKKLVNIRKPIKKGDTLLHFAAKYNYESLAKFLLNQDLSIVNQTNSYGQTPFEVAMTHGNTGVATLLACADDTINDEKFITTTHYKERVFRSMTRIDNDSLQKSSLRLSR